MILRSLTKAEEEELARLKLSKEECGFQILIAMAVIDLAPDLAFNKPITVKDLESLLYKIYDGFQGYPIHQFLIEIWITKIVEQNCIEDEIKADRIISNLEFGLLDSLFRTSCGIIGKKQKEIYRQFKEINDELYEQRHVEMYELPLESYQFIVTCFDFMGIKRQPSTGNQIIDVSNIMFDDIF